MKNMKYLGMLVSEAVLSGTVWIDEVYFDVSGKEKTAGENSVFPRRISRNKVCAELAVDSSGRAYACAMGTGKPTSAMIFWALRGHVAQGSLIVHDRFHGHRGDAHGIEPEGGPEVRKVRVRPQALRLHGSRLCQAGTKPEEKKRRSPKHV
jgi:hypothetical protein